MWLYTGLLNYRGQLLYKPELKILNNYTKRSQVFQSNGQMVKKRNQNKHSFHLILPTTYQAKRTRPVGRTSTPCVPILNLLLLKLQWNVVT